MIAETMMNDITLPESIREEATNLYYRISGIDESDMKASDIADRESIKIQQIIMIEQVETFRTYDDIRLWIQTMMTLVQDDDESQRSLDSHLRDLAEKLENEDLLLSHFHFRARLLMNYIRETNPSADLVEASLSTCPAGP